MPLVLAGCGEEPEAFTASPRSLRLRRGVDYSTDSGWRNVNFKSRGLDRLQRELGCGEFHAEENIELLMRLNMALHAEVLLSRMWTIWFATERSP